MDNVDRNEARCMKKTENLVHDSFLDGLSDSYLSENTSISSADLRLRFQRILAESILEKSGCQNDRSTTSAHFNSFNSFGTFQENDLSGQSTPRDKSNCNGGNVFPKLDINADEEIEAIFRKYSEDFVPAVWDIRPGLDLTDNLRSPRMEAMRITCYVFVCDLDGHPIRVFFVEEAVQKFVQDEHDRKRELKPVICEKLDGSNFSGIVGDAEVSVSSSFVGGNSSAKKKLGIEEYFALRTNACDDLQGRPSSLRNRPNFGNDIASPVHHRPLIALVDLTEDDLSASQDLTHANGEVINCNTATALKFESSNAPSSISFAQQSLSLTVINDALSEHYQDSPPTIARNIMNPKNNLKQSQTMGLHDKADISSRMLTEESKNDWINIEMPVKLDAYLGSEAKVMVPLRSQSSRWIKCNITVTKLTCNEKLGVEQGTLAEVYAPDYILIGPNNSADQMVTVLPMVIAPLTIELCINLEDAVTKKVQTHTRIIECSVRLPKVKFTVDGKITNEVNFGSLPEMCSSSKHVGIVNLSDEKTAWTLEVEEVSHIYKTFFIKTKKDTDSDKSSQIEDTGTLPIHIVFRAPCVENKDDMENGLLHFTAYLNVSIGMTGKSCLIHKLKLTGSVGLCKMLLSFKSPIVLESNLSESVSQTFLIKNDGFISLNLKLMIAHPESWEREKEGVISIDNSILCINGGKEGAFTLTFTPNWTFEELLKRVVLIQVEPEGKMFETEIHCRIMRKQDIIKKRLSSQSSGSGTTVSRSSSQSCGTVFGMPVRTTHREIVWGTVVIGKTVKQSCRLQNQWPHSVKIVLNLVDPTHSYRLHNGDGESVMEYAVKLMPKECVGLNISFHPSKVGPAHGKITMYQSRGEGERFAIPLYGFGGSMKLSLRNIPYDKTGQMWLNLGQIDQTMQSQFMIQNKGSVAAFAFCKFSSKDLGHLTQWNVEIQPSCLIIGAGCTETVSLNCRVNENTSFITDYDREVIEIGILTIIYGDEPTRHRIRRIRDKQRGEAKTNHVLASLNDFCSPIPGETPIPDIRLLDASQSALRILYHTFQRYEISLNVDRSHDRSLAMQTCIGAGNFSSLFQSVILDRTLYASVSETVPDTAWSVTPCVITLQPPQYPGACFTITNNYKQDQIFEVSSSESWLSINPSSGVILSTDEALVGVQCRASLIKTTPVTATLKVFLENDVKTITVNVKHTTDKSTPASKCLPGIK